jgi:hypothetical protein
MVNGESLMFIGKTDTENNIYKFNVNGQEILKYVNSDNRILFFNDSLTLISDAESKMIGLNPDGTTAFTDGPFEVQGFYPADESVVFTYRDQNGNYSIKKIDDTGKQIFCRGTYEYIPTFVYTSNRSQTVYGYRTDNGTHLVVIDKKGTVMIDEVIFGINASRYNSRMPFGYETEVLYLRSDDKVTKIIFEKQVLSDRLIIW